MTEGRVVGWRRTALALFAVLGVLLFAVAVVPEASAQEKVDPICRDGKAPDNTGTCADGSDPVCPDGSEPKEGSCPPTTTTTTTRPCPDGSEPKEGTCPPTTTTTCPDGGDFCNQIASCPVDNPLGGGSRCEPVAAPTTTAPEPPSPGPSPTGEGADVRGRVVEQPAPAPAPAPPPAAVAPPVAAEDLARTGSAENALAAVGAALMLVGWLFVRLARRPAGFVPE